MTIKETDITTFWVRTLDQFLQVLIVQQQNMTSSTIHNKYIAHITQYTSHTKLHWCLGVRETDYRLAMGCHCTVRVWMEALSSTWPLRIYTDWVLSVILVLRMHSLEMWSVCSLCMRRYWMWHEVLREHTTLTTLTQSFCTLGAWWPDVFRWWLFSMSLCFLTSAWYLMASLRYLWSERWILLMSIPHI